MIEHRGGEVPVMAERAALNNVSREPGRWVERRRRRDVRDVTVYACILCGPSVQLGRRGSGWRLGVPRERVSSEGRGVFFSISSLLRQGFSQGQWSAAISPHHGVARVNSLARAVYLQALVFFALPFTFAPRPIVL